MITFPQPIKKLKVCALCSRRECAWVQDTAGHRTWRLCEVELDITGIYQAVRFHKCQRKGCPVCGHSLAFHTDRGCIRASCYCTKSIDDIMKVNQTVHYEVPIGSRFWAYVMEDNLLVMKREGLTTKIAIYDQSERNESGQTEITGGGVTYLSFKLPPEAYPFVKIVFLSKEVKTIV